MKKIREIAARLKAKIVGLYYVATISLAVFAFLTPLLTSATEEEPTGGAGLYAALIALCAAAILISEAATNAGSPMRRLPSIFIGIGCMANAYLWVAEEAEIHPANPLLLGSNCAGLGFSRNGDSCGTSDYPDVQPAVKGPIAHRRR